MKRMWIDCKGCGAPVRNSHTSIAKHDKSCVALKIEEARRVAVAAIAERNELRLENFRLREQLQAVTT